MNELSFGKCYKAYRHRSGTSPKGNWELITSFDDAGRNQVTIFVKNQPSQINEGDTFKLGMIYSIRVGFKKDRNGAWEKVISLDADVFPPDYKIALCDDPFSEIPDLDDVPDPFADLVIDTDPVPPERIQRHIQPQVTDKTAENKCKDLLDRMIGLEEVKAEAEEIISMAKMQKIRAEHGLPEIPVSRHLVFSGNPGSGKTTVARALAEEYKACGVLSKGHIVEVSRSDLVAEYVGQTAVKTKKVLEKARGGVLFIDEAYTLISHTAEGYGQEAIDTILKDMEDGRDDLVVIAAGYTRAMEAFLNTNPGLRSRFKHTIKFPDYTADEMYEIFEQMAAKFEYRLEEDASSEIRSHLALYTENKPRSFANGRDVRNLFEDIARIQASRLLKSGASDDDQLKLITKDDVVPALQRMKPAEPEEHKNRPVRKIGF